MSESYNGSKSEQTRQIFGRNRMNSLPDLILGAKRTEDTTRTYLKILVSNVASVDYSRPRTTSKRYQMSRIYFSFCLLLCEITLLRGELWEKDFTSFMKIGLSTSGYSSVDLRCGTDHFSVNITLEEDFQGVVYTRGSFSDKKLPCFKRHDQKTSNEKIKFYIGLRIPFHKCGTVMDVAESHYTNTVVVQHDPDLIMPGDAAFRLDCAFVPEFKVNSDINVEPSHFKSRITLVDADPSKEATNTQEPLVTVLSKSDRITFVPDSTAHKDEL